MTTESGVSQPSDAERKPDCVPSRLLSMYEHVEGSDGVYVVDTLMFGIEGYAASFFIDGEDPVVVDTGLQSDGENVLEAIREIGVEPEEVEYIVVTHVHLDHAGGIGVVAEACPNATIVTHERSVPYLTDEDRASRLVEKVHEVAGSMADAYGGIDTVEDSRVVGVTDGTAIDTGERELEVLETTGHAPHHVSLYDDLSGGLFVVDEGCAYMNGTEAPTTPPPDFDYECTLESFDRFERYDPNYLLYGHYGVNYDGSEAIQRHREALKGWVSDIRASWERHGEKKEVIEEVLNEYGDEIENPVVWQILRRDIKGVLGWILNPRN